MLLDTKIVFYFLINTSNGLSDSIPEFKYSLSFSNEKA